MIKHFAADGSVKREWPEGLHATPAVRDGKTFTQVQGSNSVLAEIELADGEQVGESFVDAIANTLAAAGVKPFSPDVHPDVAVVAESALDHAMPVSLPEPSPENTTQHPVEVPASAEAAPIAPAEQHETAPAAAAAVEAEKTA